MTTFEMVESSVDYFIWALAINQPKEIEKAFKEMKQYPDEWLEAVVVIKKLRFKIWR